MSNANRMAAGYGTGALVGGTLGGIAGSFIPGGTAGGIALGSQLGGAAGAYLGQKTGPGQGRVAGSLEGTRRQQEQLEGELESARMQEQGAFDRSAESTLAFQKQAVDLMRSAMGVPAASMLSTLGAAQLGASGAAAAQARESARLAGRQTTNLGLQVEEALARLGLQKAGRQMEYVKEDITAATTAADKAAADAAALAGQYGFGSDAVAALRQKRDLYEPGSPEYEAYNNEANRQAMKFLSS